MATTIQDEGEGPLFCRHVNFGSKKIFNILNTFYVCQNIFSNIFHLLRYLEEVI